MIVGALFELSLNSTGKSFYQGKTDDPSMAQPLYIAAFPREDGTMAIAWQRPRRRNTQLGSAEYGECDMFPADDTGGDRVQEQAGAGRNDDWLGESTATPPAKCGRCQGPRHTRWRAAAARQRLIGKSNSNRQGPQAGPRFPAKAADELPCAA